MRQRRTLGFVAGTALAVALVAGAAHRASAGGFAFDLSGPWDTHWGSNQSTVVLHQTGTWVTGTFTSTASPPGALAGRLQGNLLVGRWTDPTSSGGFRLVISADGRSFTGTWGATVDSVDSGGEWSGRR